MGMKIFRKIWNEIERFVIKTQTDRKTGELFLAAVLALGAVGFIFCLGWFACLIMEGMPVGWLIFDAAVIIFCLWAIIWGVVPMAKETFGWIEKIDEDKNNEGN